MDVVNGKVLLTGATGYVGSRLLRALEERGCTVRCLSRQPEKVSSTCSTTEVVRGDCLDEASLDEALAGVHSAYYLVHSMDAGSRFVELDRQAATTFARAAARAGVRRIIYLGGLADDLGALSPHLRSRAETGKALRSTGVPVIEFRASIIVGAGSLSFEMIRALVERLPVMVCPRWVTTETQPIAIDDVIAYLTAALDLPDAGSRVFEIGGPDTVSYGDIMREYARLRGLRRWLLLVPVLTPRLSSLWLALVTPAQARVGRALVDGLRNTTVVRSPAALTTFRIAPMPLHAAFVRAIDEGAAARLKHDTRTVTVDVAPVYAFAPVRRIGGANGWYFGDPLWQLRGRIDRWFGGVGMQRGRRDPEVCGVGDVIDGWTVDRYIPERLLRLSADLKLPGRGWLEFEVTPLAGERSSIRQTATFDPRGVLGHAYWYAILPFHAFIFRGLLRRLAQLAVGAHQRAVMIALMAVLTMTSVHAQRSEPVRTVDAVDLNRYVGDWSEIGRFPNRFQRRCVGAVTARYQIRPDGRLDVINRCRTADGDIEARGVARVVDSRTSAKLKVRFAPAALSFLPFVWGDYWVLGLADDYSWAVVGSPDRNYLWILARTTTLDAERYDAAVAVARGNGFDVERLIKSQ